jgi:DNA-binding NtrC family response regulator
VFAFGPFTISTASWVKNSGSMTSSSRYSHAERCFLTMIAGCQPCCLVAEDQALISLALEDTLEDAGLAVAGPFASCQEALSWAEEHTPEVAIIDFQLKDGPCTELARELRRRGVPVIIYSGYPHGETIPPEFDGLPWLEKPTAQSDLLAAMAQVAPSVAEHLPQARP